MATTDIVEPAKNKPAEGQVKCSMCLNPIWAGARKCTHCDSYQGRLGYLTVGNIVLAVLVALLSVVSLAYLNAQKALHRPDSQMTVQFQDIIDEHVFLMVSNPGDRSGGLGAIELRIKGVRPKDIVLPVRVIDWSVGKTLVKPADTTQIDLFLEKPIVLTEREVSLLRTAQCELVINTTEFSGRTQQFVFKRPCEALRRFMVSQRV